jgi:hypothetical protein
VRFTPKFQITTVSALFASCLLLPPTLDARCPIPTSGTLEIDAAAGNLIIDTSGMDAVEWDVSNKQIDVKEYCGSTVRLVGKASGGTIKTIPEWHIKVPRTVTLDLVTRAGSITIGNSDSKVNARTGGGDISVGNVSGETLLMSQAGYVKAGNIGSDIEIRISYGGNLVIGDVDGNVNAWTSAGDVTIGTAKRISNAFTGGGNMLIHKVVGPFSGKNEAGSIRIMEAGSSVDATTGSGSIYLKMVPDKQTGDFHVNLKAGTSGSGDITLLLPAGMKADVQATAQGGQVHADFPMMPQISRGTSSVIPVPSTAGQSYASQYSSFTTTQTGTRNGGGNPVRLHTTLGKIEIKLFN